MSATETMHAADLLAVARAGDDAALPATERAALVLRDVLAWDAADVAELLNATVPQVNRALLRARGALATTLGEYGSAAAPRRGGDVR